MSLPSLSALNTLSISGRSDDDDLRELRRGRSFLAVDDDDRRERDYDDEDDDKEDDARGASNRRRTPQEEPVHVSEYSTSVLIAKCLPFEFEKFISTSKEVYQNAENTTYISFTSGKTLLDDVNYFYNNFKFPENYNSSTSSLEGFQEFANTRILPVEAGRAAICSVLDKAKYMLTYGQEESPEEMDILSKRGYYQRKDLSGNHVYIIGDTHGSLHSLCDIFMQMDKEGAFYKYGDVKGTLKRNVYVVCTGDLLDRSPYTLETAYLMIRLFADNPNQVTITLGNHETDAELWTTRNGTMKEVDGEYENRCGMVGDMEKKLKETLLLFPRSLIAETNLGVIQFNHGTFETITKMEDILTFRAFTSFQSDKNKIPIFDDKEGHLNWGDVATDPTVSGVQGMPGRPLRTSNDLDIYLTQFELRLLIRGHSDMANLSLVYRDGYSPSPALQAQDASPVPPGPILWNLYGFQYPDQRPRMTIRPHATFVLGLRDLQNDYSYDMYVLSFLPNTGSVTKTLIQEGRDDESQDDLKAVTSSTAVFSKLMPPFMTKSCFLYIQ